MKLAFAALMCAAMAAAPAFARLPPPSPEQQAAAEQKKAEEAQKAREQQDALTRVQDRIAAKFGRAGSGKGAGPTARGDLPQKAVEARGAAGPSGGKEQSAEAHSTPAR
jgi:hypothetical protein